MDPELKKALEQKAELEKQVTTLSDRVRALEGQSTMVALSTTIGLAATATQDDVRAKVVSLAGFRKDVLALAGKDSEAGAIGALSAMKEQAGEAVVLRSKLEMAETAAVQSEFEAVMADASKNGIIPPAKEHPRHMFALSISGAAAGKVTREGLVALKSFVGTLDPLVGDGKEKKAPSSAIALSAVELEIAQRSGSNVETLIKHKERKLAAGGTSP